MDNESVSSKFIEKTRKITSLIANLTIIIGIIFAGIQLWQTKDINRKQVAIEAVSKTKTDDFLKAYARLKTIYKIDNINMQMVIQRVYNDDYIQSKILMIDDINYIMNTYNNIAILYLNEIADKDIIKSSIYSEMREFSNILENILDKSAYPNGYRKNFDMLLESLEKK